MKQQHLIQKRYFTKINYPIQHPHCQITLLITKKTTFKTIGIKRKLKDKLYELKKSLSNYKDKKDKNKL